MAATLIALRIISAIAAEITVLQAEEAGLAPTQASMTTSSLVTPTTSGLHDVTFLVSSQCGGRPSGWTISKWGVTFGNATKIYPLNADLSQIRSESGDFVLGGTDLTSSITFAVPDGTYPFQLYPNASERGAQCPFELIIGPSTEDQLARRTAGVIDVSGFDLEFCLSYPAVVA